MSAPVKAKKNVRNRDQNFDETILSAVPITAESIRSPQIVVNKLKLGLGVIWIAAALSGGVGTGLLIRHNVAPAYTAEVPTPITQAPVSVSAVLPGSVTLVYDPVAHDLVMTKATDINQAQAGTTFVTTLATSIQGPAGSGALQPGFAHFMSAQGNIGTIPVH